MPITIQGSPKEIAALIVAIQERQAEDHEWLKNIVETLTTQTDYV